VITAGRFSTLSDRELPIAILIGEIF